MNIQNYLTCILYLILLIAHSFTLCHKDFHRGLVAIFTFALVTETLSAILETLHQVALSYRQQFNNLTHLDLSPLTSFLYPAQLLHITAINFFILFLLIVAKGWPITRRDIPFKYAFAIFWLMCLAADLITFYWTTISAIAKNFNIGDGSTLLFNGSITNNTMPTNQTMPSSVTLITTTEHSLTTLSPTTDLTTLDSTNEHKQFNSTPSRLSLLLRIVIMVYFLLELRTTMILEQEKKKLRFYLHFGALSMVWFVHTVIVYIISLRVDSNWQNKLISGFSSAANFLGFAVTTRLLWPKNSVSQLFRKTQKVSAESGYEEGAEIENMSTINNSELGDLEDYDGLEMRDLNGSKRNMTENDNGTIETSIK